jgi:ArsR family transcriptional regulator, arsenate/arsenite/antimonite-responsive transcriptional repressor
MSREQCERLTPFPTAARNGNSAHSRPHAIPGEMMRELMAVTKALADEQRVRMLLALRRQELCVCQIVELVGLATSTVSKHMSILKQARLVESRKEGRWMYYRLPCDDAPELVRQATAWVFEHLGNDPSILRDEQKLEEICRVAPHTLCTARGDDQSGGSKTRPREMAARPQ